MLGYTGTACADDIDDCLSQPCGTHGSCTDTGLLDYACVCDSGYSGTTCTTDIDDCLSSPCSGSATCVDAGANSFTCSCPSEFTGSLCADDVDDCGAGASGDGVCGDHGTCVDEGTNSFVCVCDTGYEGSTCTEETDDCASSPCEDTATCADHGVAAFYCDCPAGYEGTTCAEEIDDCASDPCGVDFSADGNWQCTDTGINSYVCTCEDGWGGSTCEDMATCTLGFGNADESDCICTGRNNVAEIVYSGTQTSGFMYEYPCCNDHPNDPDSCVDPELGTGLCNSRKTTKSNCLSNDGQEGLIECYTPGYLIDGGVTGAGTSCSGTVGACESLVTCHTDAGYSGLAVVTCPTDQGHFRFRGCSRDPTTSNTGVVYSVIPFQACKDSNSFLLSTLNGVSPQVRKSHHSEPYQLQKCTKQILTSLFGDLLNV